jgi:hypothetical protein
MSEIIGALLCSHPDCCPESQRIGIGQAPEVNQSIALLDGTTRTITIPAVEVTLSTALRDVIGKHESGLYQLSCGHLHPGLPLISAQEWLTLPDGSIFRGEGLPAHDSHVSHRATYRTRTVR